MHANHVTAARLGEAEKHLYAAVCRLVSASAGAALRGDTQVREALGDSAAELERLMLGFRRLRWQLATDTLPDAAEAAFDLGAVRGCP